MFLPPTSALCRNPALTGPRHVCRHSPCHGVKKQRECIAPKVCCFALASAFLGIRAGPYKCPGLRDGCWESAEEIEALAYWDIIKEMLIFPSSSGLAFSSHIFLLFSSNPKRQCWGCSHSKGNRWKDKALFAAHRAWDEVAVPPGPMYDHWNERKSRLHSVIFCQFYLFFQFGFLFIIFIPSSLTVSAMTRGHKHTWL